MTKTLVITAATFLVGATAWGQTRRHEIVFRDMDTAEEQLLYDQKRTIGLKKFEVDKQLKEVRRGRPSYYRPRSGSQTTTVYSPNRNQPRRHRPAPYRRPEPDWKTVETPFVTVKGTMKIDGRMAALVSHGQIVNSNEVFATTYQGQTRYWRVREINDIGAEFDRVTASGAPYVEPQPEPERRGFFAAFFTYFDRQQERQEQQARRAELVRRQLEGEAY